MLAYRLLIQIVLYEGLVKSPVFRFREWRVQGEENRNAENCQIQKHLEVFPLILKTSQVLLKHTSSVEYHADISQVRKQVSSVLRFCKKHSWRYFERSTKIEAVKTPGKVIPFHASHGPAASLLMLNSSRRLQITPIVQSMRLN